MQLLCGITAHTCVDQFQPLFSPYSIQYPDIAACSAHDSTTRPTPSPDHYSAIQEEFCNAPWRHTGELEPKDPTTGRSVLHALLEEFTNGSKGRISKCRLCNRTFSRADRAITHLRHKHLDHRPFWCEGDCGTKGWCEASCMSPLNVPDVPCSRQRFHSQENLTPHVKPKMVPCLRWLVPVVQYVCAASDMRLRSIVHTSVFVKI